MYGAVRKSFPDFLQGRPGQYVADQEPVSFETLR